MFKSFRRVALVLALVLGTAAVLAWYDVLPGGWTLRGWVKPHTEREAEEQARRSARRVAGFRRENQSVPAGAVVWLGSSTIERFPLFTSFPDGHHLNRGIGNESADGLLARLDESLPSARPRLAVLYVGSIDFRDLGHPPDHIAASTRAVIDRLRTRYGGSLPVLVIGILPERGMPAEMITRLRATNLALSATCAQADGLAFLDPVRPPIALTDGGLNPDLSADRLHLNAAGYAQLAAWLEETGLFE